MKRFACGDVVPGCEASWVCSTEDELLAAVAAHARVDHGLTARPELISEVLRHTVSVR